MDILVTNNPLVEAHFKGTFIVDFIDADLLGVLIHTRNMIHKGHRLLTHPLMGSVKPNESPYKSVLISGTNIIENTDVQSVAIIEECIITSQKFAPKNIPEKYLKDLQMVDLSLIQSATL